MSKVEVPYLVCWLHPADRKRDRVKYALLELYLFIEIRSFVCMCLAAAATVCTVENRFHYVTECMYFCIFIVLRVVQRNVVHVIKFRYERNI